MSDTGVKKPATQTMPRGPVKTVSQPKPYKG